MATSNKALAGMLIAIVAIVGFAFYFMSGAHGSTITVQGSGSGGSTGGASLSCPSVAQVIQGVAYYNNFATTPVTKTQIAGNSITLYIPGQTLAYAAGTASSTAPVSISGVNCNTQYLVTYGDQAAYLLNYTTVNTGEQVNTPAQLLVLKYSAPTILTTNAVSTPLATQTIVHNVAAGQTVTTAGVSVQSGSGYDSEGPGALVFTYNSAAITSITLPGATSINTGLLPAPTYVTTNTVYGIAFVKYGVQNAQSAFSIPSANNYAYATVGGPTSSPTTMNPSIVTSSSFAVNEIIGVSWVPATDYFNLGGPNVGTVSTGVFINPTTSAALVTPTATVNAINLGAGF